MLLNFTFGNFRSIAEEQTVSFEATDLKELESRTFTLGKRRLLRSLVLYGGNASGKSNVCRALHAMRRIVLESATEINRGDPLPEIEPFVFRQGLRNSPTRFEVALRIGPYINRYGFEASAEAIMREWLHRHEDVSRKRPIRVFERTGGAPESWLFGELIPKSDRDVLRERTRPNGLILSKAAQENVEALNPVFDWFQEKLRVVNMASPPDRLIRRIAQECKSGTLPTDRVAEVGRVADQGVADATVGPREIKIPAELAAGINPARPRGTSEVPAKYVVPEIRLARKDDRSQTVDLPFSEESNGTQRFVAIALMILDALALGQTLVIDELECSLHPMLTREILEVMNDDGLTDGGAQFLIATHDANLLDFSLLRRDQFLFAEKSREHATEIFSMADLEPLPKREGAAQKQYLANRFGAVPNLGNLRSVLAKALAHGVDGKGATETRQATPAG